MLEVWELRAILSRLRIRGEDMSAFVVIHEGNSPLGVHYHTLQHDMQNLFQELAIAT
jgi:hypothetical protein